ncbi:MAG: hypothetical protein LKG90_08530 [Lachnospiraceae bacterium]|nr:hypothetical protein [Lachnospiraceae bacterium]MCH4028404.1 hypothetical protein [Lachnospiraceae bacterium]MCH4066252.1 hypothetical protein [Lachnospiraceae bacterium]MCH4112284.1 hypothetical protein [Lachnospiraceae bacterium]MCI1391457.1 hypothetical protein [Lachnospiraceae bacterium]
MNQSKMPNANNIYGRESTYTRSAASKVTLQETLYLAYFSFCIFAVGIGKYDGQLIYYIFTSIGLIALLIKLFTEEHSLFEYIWIALFAALGLTVYHVTGDKGLFLCILTMVGMKNVDERRVFKVGLSILLTTFVSMWLLSYLGVIHETVYYKAQVGDVFCHSFGYPHTNVTQIVYLVLVEFILYLVGMKSIKRTALWCVLLLIGNVIVFLFTLGRTGFAATTVYIIVNLYLCARKKLSRFGRFLIQLTLPACILFICVFPALVTGKLFDFCNYILTYRYEFARYYLLNQPITLFGDNYNYLMFYHVIDSSWLYLLKRYGIIAFTIITAIYFGLLKDQTQNNKMSELSITVTTVISGTVEQFLFNTSFKNLTLIFAGSYIFELSENVEKHLPPLFQRKLRIIHLREITVDEKNIPILWYYYKLRNLFQIRMCWNIIAPYIIILVVGIIFIGLSLKQIKGVYYPGGDVYYTKQQRIEIEQKGYAFYSLSDGNSFTHVVASDDIPLNYILYEGNIVCVENARRLLFWELTWIMAFTISVSEFEKYIKSLKHIKV